MIYTLKIGRQGDLQIPSEILPDNKPDTRYQLEIQGETLILRPQKAPPFWVTATREQRAAKFRDWATQTQRPATSPLPDDALSRENIYN